MLKRFSATPPPDFHVVICVSRLIVNDQGIYGKNWTDLFIAHLVNACCKSGQSWLMKGMDSFP